MCLISPSWGGCARMIQTKSADDGHLGALPRLAFRLLEQKAEGSMEAVVIGTTLLGSFVGAFVIQKVALEGIFRMMGVERRNRH